jgi:hypothetical protein
VSNVTRTELRTRARIRASQENLDFPSDTAYNYFLDEARKEVWFDLVGAGWPANYTSQTITATGASQYQIASGAAVLGVQGVYWVQGTLRYQMQRLDPSFKAEVLSAPTQQAVYYELLVDATQGTVIRFYPNAASGSYQVDYIPEIAGFSNDSDVWYGPARSDELLVIRAAEKAMKKEGPARLQEAAGLRSEYGEVFEKVTNAASWVDMRNTARIRDTQRSAVRDPFAYPVAGPDSLLGWP